MRRGGGGTKALNTAGGPLVGERKRKKKKGKGKRKQKPKKSGEKMRG